MTSEHSHPAPSSIRDDSICEPSLNANKSSGDIVERLQRQGEGSDGYRTVFNGLLLDAAAEIEGLRREVEETRSACAQTSNSYLNRALTAESAVAAAWEEAAKIAEDTPTTVSMFLTKREADAATLTKLAIASAIRAAGSKKTAESGHSPSTHNSESE